MRYIDGFGKPLCSELASTIEKRIFLFDMEEDAEDYFLEYVFAWDKIKTEFFKVKIDNFVYTIPSGTYLLCGCVGGSQDWATVDELIGRPIDVFIMNSEFRGWSLAPIKVIDTFEHECYVPMTKKPVPVFDESGKKVIITASTDLYHKMKDKDFDMFFVS